MSAVPLSQILASLLRSIALRDADHREREAKLGILKRDGWLS